jgi:hypothetical protein
MSINSAIRGSTTFPQSTEHAGRSQDRASGVAGGWLRTVSANVAASELDAAEVPSRARGDGV